jgi:TPR repeat protein
LVAIYFGAFQGVAWVGYATIAFVWFMLFTYTAALLSEEALRKLAERRQPVPKWMGHLFDVAVLAAFLIAEWYLTALVYAASSICAILAYAKAGSRSEKITASQPETPINLDEVRAQFRRAAGGDLSALQALERFARSGHAEAEFLMGRLYDVSNEKKAIATNLTAAKAWYEKAAAQDHPLAQYALGNMFDYGEGAAQDHKQARRWYEAAAKQNVHDAQLHFGRMLQTGRGGYQSSMEAAHWYAKAAEQGDELAATNLALMHYRREIENANDADAFGLFSFSAEKVDGLAHLMLGEMYLEGRGTEREGGRALFHFCVAALLLPAGSNRERAVSRKEIMLKQYPQHGSHLEERALNYIKERGGSLPH